MTNNEIKSELKRISANLAEQERITADLTRRITVLENQVETAKSWRVVWPDPNRGGKRER
jgi:phage-related minor tail protein